MKWLSIDDKKKPDNNQLVLLYCPNFNPEGYIVATYDSMNDEYEFASYDGVIDEQYIKAWTEFTECDDDI